MNSNNQLDLDEKSRTTWFKNIHWSRALRLSDDCHSYNVQLKFHPSYHYSINNHIKAERNPQLVLQVVKPIQSGQELLLWFSEDILAMLQIVFLTPANIQGTSNSLQKKVILYKSVQKCNNMFVEFINHLIVCVIVELIKCVCGR